MEHGSFFGSNIIFACFPVGLQYFAAMKKGWIPEAFSFAQSPASSSIVVERVVIPAFAKQSLL